MSFTQKEKELLELYFTNTDESVFTLINLPEVIKGTLFSRYSRTAKDLRRLFLDEFVQAQELEGVWQHTPGKSRVNAERGNRPRARSQALARIENI